MDLALKCCLANSYWFARCRVLIKELSFYDSYVSLIPGHNSLLLNNKQLIEQKEMFSKRNIDISSKSTSPGEILEVRIRMALDHTHSMILTTLLENVEKVII